MQQALQALADRVDSEVAYGDKWPEYRTAIAVLDEAKKLHAIRVTLPLEEMLQASRDQGVLAVLDDLLVTAIEGGSAYWSGDCLLAPEEQEATGRPWYANAFTDGLTMKVSESECEPDEDDADEDGKRWHPLDREKAIAGLLALATKHPRHFIAIVNGDDDAESADAWLQMSVLGELRYG